MKSISKTNTSPGGEVKMTLRDYYRNLPDAKEIAPKKALIEKVAMRCDVPASTARSWLIYGNKPRNTHYLTVLSEETGIPIDDLFEA